MKQVLKGNIVRKQNNGEGPGGQDGISHGMSWGKNVAQRGKNSCKMSGTSNAGGVWLE